MRKSTIPARRAKWLTDLARERRQEREAHAAGNRRKAAEHRRQIGILECLLAELERTYQPEPVGLPVQTELVLR